MESNARKNIEYNQEGKNNKGIMLKSRIEEILDINKEKNVNVNNVNINDYNFYKPPNRKKSEDYSDIYFQRLEPAGSNFQLIRPAVGVKILERSRMKSGGTNFYERYHKYSINEFNKTLQSNLEWSNYLIKDRQNDTLFANTLAKSLKKNMYNEENDKGINNPKTTINNKDSKFNKTYSTGFNTNKKNNIHKSQSEVFITNENYQLFLQTLLQKDQYDKINDYPYTEFGKKIKIKNLFKNDDKNILTSRKFIQELKSKFKDMDTFNKNLVMGKFAEEKTRNTKMILPKIIKHTLTSEFPYNKTMNHFFRQRTKKNINSEFSFNKRRIEMNNTGKMKKNFSAQRI